MKRAAALLFVVACTEEPSQPTCEPLVTLDAVDGGEMRLMAVPYQGMAVCMRVDTTSIDTPHLQVSAGGFFPEAELELRDLAHVLIVSPAACTLVWDPAGRISYDVVLNVTPPPNVIDYSTI